MVKKKYQSLDNRTGYPEGQIVELDDNELALCPFNVHLRLVDELSEKAVVEQDEIKKAAQELKESLSERGLSPGRIKKVLEKYSSLDELVKSAGKAGIDELTDEFLKKEYSSSKTSPAKPKKNEEVVEPAKEKVKESDLSGI